jgi:hypothetical protein
MSFFIPSVFTEYDLSEVDLHNPTQEELIRKMIANNNLLLDLIPIGAIIYLNDNQSQGVSINSQLWQICDGSEITNPLSPIRSLGIFQNFVPDLRDKYIRGANDEVNNNSGGSHAHGLNHTHVIGAGGGGGSGLDNETKGPGDQRHGPAHNHGLDEDLAITEIITPKFVYLNAYMKVS